MKGEVMSKQENNFEQIYNETYSDLLRYIVINCSNFEDVNDILQDTYIQLFKIIQNKSINEIRPFIFGIAKNKIKKYQCNFYKIRKNLLIIILQMMSLLILNKMIFL